MLKINNNKIFNHKMQLLYQVFCENVDEIINKKRNKIKKIETDSIKTVKDADNINEYKRRSAM